MILFETKVTQNVLAKNYGICLVIKYAHFSYVGGVYSGKKIYLRPLGPKLIQCTKKGYTFKLNKQ